MNNIINVVVTIETTYSIEKYFFQNINKNNIEVEIFNILIEMGDPYEIIEYKEVDQDYISARNKAMAEYKKLFNESVEDAFLQHKYTTLEAIRNEIEIERRKEDK